MKKSLISMAVLAAFAAPGVVRARTRDVAFTYRMGAGFAGDVNRTHPASIVPGMNDATDPVRLYGDPALFDVSDNTYRGFVAGDQSDTVEVALAGVLVRPYPVQQSTGGMSATLGGSQAPVSGQPQDFLDDGFIMVKCNSGSPVKGGAVFVWCTASAGAHVQGGFEAAADAGDTVKVLNAEWVGPKDANGIAELRVFKQRYQAI